MRVDFTSAELEMVLREQLLVEIQPLIKKVIAEFKTSDWALKQLVETMVREGLEARKDEIKPLIDQAIAVLQTSNIQVSVTIQQSTPKAKA